MEDKVNAVFHYYAATDLAALSEAQRKLLIADGYSIDKETKATGYRVLEVSKADVSRKLSVACTPDKKECFVSITK